MLDPKFLRENVKDVKANYKRFKNPELIKLVDDFVKADGKLRKLKLDIDNLRRKRNEYSQQVNKLRKEGKSIDAVLKKVKAVPGKIKDKETEFEAQKVKVGKILLKLPNIIHEKVPYGEDDSENVELKKSGKKVKFNFEPKNHIELLENLGLVDFDTSANISGNGFYVLKGDLALLNQALIRYTIDFMTKKGYYYIEPPLMLRREVLAAALDVSEFDKTIYSIEGEDLNLIGTSEHALLGMHLSEIFEEKDLPKKYFSYTMCFRKEIGSHGINEKGLWRTHQFNKVEQFIFCKPSESWKMFDELLKNTEELFKSLGLAYRVLEICTGDLGLWKARSIDLEVWRPTTKEYGEVTSLTNCTSYQAQPFGTKIKYKNGEKELVHTLNNTALATSRALVAIIETYQQKDGTIKVPDVLVSYMGKKLIK